MRVTLNKTHIFEGSYLICTKSKIEGNTNVLTNKKGSQRPPKRPKTQRLVFVNCIFKTSNIDVIDPTY